MDGLEYCVLDFLSIVPVFHINTQEETVCAAGFQFDLCRVGVGRPVMKSNCLFRRDTESRFVVTPPSVRPIVRARRSPRKDPQNTVFPVQPCRR